MVTVMKVATRPLQCLYYVTLMRSRVTGKRTLHIKSVGLSGTSQFHTINQSQYPMPNSCIQSTMTFLFLSKIHCDPIVSAQKIWSQVKTQGARVQDEQLELKKKKCKTYNGTSSEHPPKKNK